MGRDPERNKIPRNHLWTAAAHVPGSRIYKAAIMRLLKDEGKEPMNRPDVSGMCAPKVYIIRHESPVDWGGRKEGDHRQPEKRDGSRKRAAAVLSASGRRSLFQFEKRGHSARATAFCCPCVLATGLDMVMPEQEPPPPIGGLVPAKAGRTGARIATAISRSRGKLI